MNKSQFVESIYVWFFSQFFFLILRTLMVHKKLKHIDPEFIS